MTSPHTHQRRPTRHNPGRTRSGTTPGGINYTTEQGRITVRDITPRSTRNNPGVETLYVEVLADNAQPWVTSATPQHHKIVIVPQYHHDINRSQPTDTTITLTTPEPSHVTVTSGHNHITVTITITSR